MRTQFSAPRVLLYQFQSCICVSDGQIILVRVHVLARGQRGSRRVPRARRCTGRNRIGIGRVFINFYRNSNGNKLVFAHICTGYKCVGCCLDVCNDIDAFAVVDFGFRCAGDSRLGNRDRDGGVINRDNVLLFFILDAGTGVGGLGAAVVVVGMVNSMMSLLPCG